MLSYICGNDAVLVEGFTESKDSLSQSRYPKMVNGYPEKKWLPRLGFLSGREEPICDTALCSVPTKLY